MLSATHLIKLLIVCFPGRTRLRCSLQPTETEQNRRKSISCACFLDRLKKGSRRLWITSIQKVVPWGDICLRVMNIPSDTNLILSRISVIKIYTDLDFKFVKSATRICVRLEIWRSKLKFQLSNAFWPSRTPHHRPVGRNYDLRRLQHLFNKLDNTLKLINVFPGPIAFRSGWEKNNM